MALAKAAGGSGYSANLSTNTTIRKQQLLCDPAEPRAGSTSVLYDASLVSLIGYQPGPGYDNKGFLGLVEVHPPGGNNTVLQPLVAFLSNPLGTQTGFVQVKYQLDGQAGQLQPDPGFTVVDEGGVTGVDTHGLMFELLPGVPVDAPVNYTVYAETGGKHGNNEPDFLEVNDENHTMLGPDDLSPAHVNSDQAPVADAGGPYTIDEGGSLTLHGSASDGDSPAGSLVFSWDLNGDSTPDAFGTDPVISASGMQSLGLGDGPLSMNITLTVSDGVKAGSDTASLTVNNVKPGASLSGIGSLGGPVVMTLAATDPSAADRAAGFTYLIDWGDGTPTQTIAPTGNNGAGITSTHIYSSIGTFTVTLRAKDKDGAVSDPVSVQITVGGAKLLPDPSQPSKLALFVFGSDSGDVIRFAKSGGGLQVFGNGSSLGTFKGFTRVIALGNGGDDDIRLSDAAGVFFGGNGNDTLVAGNVGSILSGGAGNDTTIGGNAKDLLIGGSGADALNGGDAQDILLAGRSSFDAGTNADIIALTAILNEWTRASSYTDSIGHITGTLGGGLNGSAFFKTSGAGQTVFDDDALDVLTGGNGRDWLLFNQDLSGVLDLTDLSSTEIGTGI